MKNKFLGLLIILIICIVLLASIIISRNHNEEPIPKGTPYKVSDYEEQPLEVVAAKPYSSNIVLSGIENIYFNSDEIIYPTKLYLEDDSISAFYHDRNNIIINIPVEMCQKDDERIVFGNDEVILYKNSCKLEYKGKDFLEDSNISLDKLTNVFYGYFCMHMGEQETYVYKIDLDNNPSTEEISMSFFKGDDLKDEVPLQRHFLSVDNEGLKVIYSTSNNIGSKIAENIYLNNEMYKNYSVNDISEELVPFSYYSFDKKDGFKLVFALADGTNATINDNILEIEFTLNADYYIEPYPVDGKYSELASYCIVRGEKGNWLNKGTKFHVVKIIDENGNAIIETEDGLKVLLGDN